MSIETRYTLSCDACGVEREGSISERSLEINAISDGWIKTDDGEFVIHLCPACAAKQEKKP